MAQCHVQRGTKTRDFSEESLFPQGIEQIRIVLIGKTGSGKSATGNTILQRNVFKSEKAACPVTTKTTSNKVQINNTTVTVVDTPGFLDAECERQTLEKEIVKCVALSVPGPNAFLYVIPSERFTDRDIIIGKAILDLFGAHIYDNMIIVFTRKDDLDPGQSFESYFDTFTPPIRQLIEKCGNRILSVGNRISSQEEKKQFRRDLLTMIRAMQTRYYINDMLQEATEAFRKALLNAPKEDRRKIMDILRKEIENEGHFFKKLKEGTIGALVCGICTAGLMVTPVGQAIGRVTDSCCIL